MSKLVSIIIPTKNRRALLAQAMESCCQQTYPNLEIVVVDGASDDGTQAYVRSLDDPRIVYVRQEKAEGFVSGLNAGFAIAKGEYLTWSSDDDWCAPQAMATLAAVLDADAGVDFVYTDYWMVDADGCVLYPGRVEDPEGLDRDNYVGHCFLYRRCVYDVLGDYRREFFLVEDYEYWLRVREQFGMKRLKVPLYYHRMHPSSLTSIHGPDKMLAAVAGVRRPYITALMHHYQVACWHYHAGRKFQSLCHACAAVWLQPWFGPAWRIAVLDILPVAVVVFLRRYRKSCAA
ncbi:MAG: glycosyltransferase [Candidatus Omnitrophota bacterium]